MRTLAQWLDYISGQHWQSIDMGLDRMREMVQRLNLSQPAPKIVTVAGTNGKGSTCVSCEALLRRSDARVGTTLSPHVQRFNERIRIDGEEVSDELICDAFAAIDRVRGDLPLTYFEFAALASLYIFAAARLDVAILEIGLGGRLDAYNVVDADVAVITSIGLDHEQFLGDTLDEIGAEKAGILRAGQQVVLGPDMPEAVLSRCQMLHLQPTQLGEHCQLEIDVEAGQWTMREQGGTTLLGISIGSIAPQNLALAYLACRSIAAPSNDDVVQVSRSLTLPGRMQRMQVDGRNWVLDVAHNPAGAAFLRSALAQRDIRPDLVVCGMLRDKHHAEVVSALGLRSDVPWLLVDTVGDRGLSAHELAASADMPHARLVDWRELIATVNSETAVGDVILLFGSFNVIEQFEILHAA